MEFLVCMQKKSENRLKIIIRIRISKIMSV